MAYQKTKHKGAREYTGETIGALAVGQGGVYFSSATTGSAIYVAENMKPPCKQFIGFQLCSQGSAAVAVTVDFNLGSGVDSSSGERTSFTFYVHPGQTVYGPMNRITHTVSATDKLLVYGG